MDLIEIDRSCSVPNKIVFPNLPPKRSLIHQYSKTSSCPQCTQDVPLCRVDYEYCSSDDEYDARIAELHNSTNCHSDQCFTLHEDGEIGAVCRDCKIVQFFCPECFQSMKFLGYDTWYDSKLNNVYLMKEISNKAKKNLTRKYFNERNLDYATASYLLTGEDGGSSHYWKCEKCEKQFSLTDK